MRFLAFLIILNCRLGVKFSTHTTNSTREKIGFRCTKCFRSVVVLEFALATVLSKFRFCSLRNTMINLVLMIKYYFDCRLQFGCTFCDQLFLWNVRVHQKYNHVNDPTAEDNGYCFLCNLGCFSKFDRLSRQS